MHYSERSRTSTDGAEAHSLCWLYARLWGKVGVDIRKLWKTDIEMCGQTVKIGLFLFIRMSDNSPVASCQMSSCLDACRRAHSDTEKLDCQ